MSDLFDDIRSDLIKTKYQNILKNYGKYFFSSIIIIIILLLFFLIKHDHEKKNQIVSTTSLFNLDKYLDSLNDEKFLNLAELFNNNSKKHHKDLAKLKLAEFYLKKQEISKSYDIFYKIFKEQNIAKATKDYAELMLNYIIYNYPSSDKHDLEIVANINLNNIFYYQILEIRALGFIEQKKITEAKNELNKITTASDASETSKNFALNLLRLLKDSDL